MRRHLPSLRFILNALALNFVLFLPQFTAFKDMWKHLPKSGYSDLEMNPILDFFLIRYHFDIFRFQCDFALLLLISLFIGKWFKSIRWSKVLLTFGYLTLLLYHIYYEFSVRLYGGHPYFKNDLALVKDVLPTFLTEVGVGKGKSILWSALLILVSISIIFYFLQRLIIDFNRIGSQAKYKLISIAITIIAVFGIVGAKYYPNVGFKNAWKTVQWIMPKVYQSAIIPESAKPSQFDQLDLYDSYQKVKLVEKPNVYLIFVESYGAVSFYSELSQRHTQFLSSLEKSLTNQDWMISSRYSKSPIIGGRSWLAFTSAMTGLQLESQLQYNHLLENYPSFPHLIRWFKDNGYMTYRMKTMSNVKKSTPRLYKLSETFYDFDEWIKFEDISYSGYKYDDYFGGVPDQYAMDQFHDEYLNRDNPYFTFFITMSSHVPWHPPPPIVDNYLELNNFTTKPSNYDQAFDQPDIYRYHDATEYSLTVMKNYIENQMKEDSTAIFIIMGDHQPPTLDYIIPDGVDKFLVPLHIIAQNPDLHRSLLDYSFVPGTLPNQNSGNEMLHAGLYSLLVDLLSRQYGNGQGIQVMMEGL